MTALVIGSGVRGASPLMTGHISLRGYAGRLSGVRTLHSAGNKKAENERANGHGGENRTHFKTLDRTL